MAYPRTRWTTLLATAVPLLLAGRSASAETISLTATASLAFGQIVATPASGAVTVAPNGTRSSSGGSLLGGSAGVRAAGFRVVGNADAVYSITLPSSTILSSGGSSMTVDAFTSSPSGSGILGPSGSQDFAVGATLHLGSLQPGGAYAGSYAVTVAYD